jgi:hypothetical protein
VKLKTNKNSTETQKKKLEIKIISTKFKKTTIYHKVGLEDEIKNK